MANVNVASDELVNLFEKVKEGKTTIPHWIEFKILCNDKQNEIHKINKTNDVVELISDGINFTITFNEEIFDGLPSDMQEMVIEEVLAGVSVNESDAISNKKPDFVTFSGMVKKYGGDEIIKYKESVEALYVQKKEKEDAIKAQTKGKRGKRQ